MAVLLEEDPRTVLGQVFIFVLKVVVISVQVHVPGVFLGVELHCEVRLLGLFEALGDGAIALQRGSQHIRKLDSTMCRTEAMYPTHVRFIRRAESKLLENANGLLASDFHLHLTDTCV